MYRGDKLKNLFERLGIFYNEDEPDYKQLLDRLFMVGEKSRNFYADEFFKASSSRSIKIDDCNEKVFKYIFDNINDSIKSKNSSTIAFFDKNEEFKQFFLNEKDNKETFLKAFSSANENEQIYFKNYYLTLLHQLDAINYKNSSHVVSTSLDSSVAQKFAMAKLSGKSVILHCWTPKNNEINNFKKHGLPKYKNAPYKNEKEVSILAGILPHYIIGLQVIEDEVFFINPNIFSNPVNDNLFIQGFNINQDGFDEIIKLTKYKKSFESQGNKIRERP